MGTLIYILRMGISRDIWHKRRATGGKRPQPRKKRKFELGRPAAMTKLGVQRIHTVRTRGGNKKYRALRLTDGNFSWGSESLSRKTRIIDVVYNPSNNELVRTKTLTKSAIVTIDATPFRQWYEAHYALPLGTKKCLEKYTERRKTAKVEPKLEDMFGSGRVFARIASSPGQCGRCDGYILEGKELEFYQKKMK